MQSASTDPQTPSSSSRRRPRHDSHTAPAPSSTAGGPSSKRPRFDVDSMATTKSVGSSARATGKLPEMADPARPSAFQPYNGAKKLVIKNLRTSNSTAQNVKAQEYYARIHRHLEASLEDGWAGNKPAVPLENLYRGVEDLCRKGDAEKIYGMLRRRMEAHVNKVILRRIERNGRNSDLEAARSVLLEWQAWNSQMVCWSNPRATTSYLAVWMLTRNLYRSSSERHLAFSTGHISYVRNTSLSTT